MRFRYFLLAGMTSMLAFSDFSITPETTSAKTAKITYWQRLKEIFRRKRRKPISRPIAQICFVTPEDRLDRNLTLVYNTKPFFLWNGNIKKVAVGIPGSQEYLKTKVVTETQSINYKGESLEPGKTYKLLIFLSTTKNASPTKFVPFKIMQAPERNQIAADLNRLEKSQKSKGADLEKIASAKAEYFAEKGLWSDALQQAYSVPNPSPELLQMKKELPLLSCESSSPKGKRSRSR